MPLIAQLNEQKYVVRYQILLFESIVTTKLMMQYNRLNGYYLLLNKLLHASVLASNEINCSMNKKTENSSTRLYNVNSFDCF